MRGHDHHPAAPNLNRLAAAATTHCLIGCGIGEVLGLVIADALGWEMVPSIGLAVVLAFIFGYGLTMRPLLGSGMSLGRATRTALVADTASITTMEIVDNGVLLLVPGAMEAGITDPFFWITLAAALAIAWVVTFPVNRWLIARGTGHAVVHGMHEGH
jgi:putative flippase GtrA